MSSSAAAATSMKSPATGLAMVASSARTAAQVSRHRSVPRAGAAAGAVAGAAVPSPVVGAGAIGSSAARPNMMPSAKVTRPAATLQESAKAPQSTTGSGRRTPARTTRWASSAAEMTPLATATVRTPNRAISQGVRTL